MLKYIIIAVCIIGIALAVYFYILGRTSQNQPAKQLTVELLAPCPATPNCVCSEYSDDERHFVTPIQVSNSSQIGDLRSFEPILINMGGQIVGRKKNYLSATFKSEFFGFVDDFEIRFDADNKKVHLRSASRVGRSDLGTNKKRIEEFKQAMTAKINNT